MSNQRSIKKLLTLEKLEKKRLDDLQILISRLSDRIDQNIENIKNHDQKMENERKMASQDVLTGLHQNAFYARMEEDRQNMTERLENLKQERTILEDQRMEHFITLKQYETLKNKKIEEDRFQEKHEESLFLDEISITRYKKNTHE